LKKKLTKLSCVDAACKLVMVSDIEIDLIS